MVTSAMVAFIAWVLVGMAFDLRRAWPSVLDLFDERRQLDAAQRRFAQLLDEDAGA